MKRLNEYRMKMILFGFVAAVVVGCGKAKADFTFGEPTNLGSTVNSSRNDVAPSISTNGLELYFGSERPGGYGYGDIWVSRRMTTEEPWGEPVNLGSTVNSRDHENSMALTSDNLTAFLCKDFSGGYGDGCDIWMTTRATRDDPWGIPVNLGPSINTQNGEGMVSVSGDGLELFFESKQSGGFGQADLYVSRRASIYDEWGPSINLGSDINSSAHDGSPCISADGLLLFFHTNLAGGFGNHDL